MKKLLLVLATILVGVFTPTRAEAQLSQDFINNTRYGAMLKANGIDKIAAGYDAKQGKPIAPKPGTVRAPLASTDFKRVGGRMTIAAFLTDPKLDAELKEAFQLVADNAFATVAKEFRADNLATAMGFAVAAAVEVSTGKDVSSDDAKVIIANVNDGMVASPVIKKMTPAQMQSLHDRLLLSTAIMITFHQMKTPSLKAMGLSLARDFLAQLN